MDFQPTCSVRKENLFYTRSDFGDDSDSDSSDDDFSPKNPDIPSRYAKTEYLFFYNHQYEDGEIELDVDKCGKWMLFSDHVNVCEARGLTEHDYRWQFMKNLVDNYENTGIVTAGCSTAWLGKKPREIGSTKGVIFCHTEDYMDKVAVKRAADAIRRVVNYPHAMYYKTDSASLSGFYRYLGYRFISLYKHTRFNVMFERDRDDPLQWNEVKF